MSDGLFWPKGLGRPNDIGQRMPGPAPDAPASSCDDPRFHTGHTLPDGMSYCTGRQPLIDPQVHRDVAAEQRRVTALTLAAENAIGDANTHDVLVMAAAFERYLETGEIEPPAPVVVHEVDMTPWVASPSGKRLCVCGDLWPCKYANP